MWPRRRVWDVTPVRYRSDVLGHNQSIAWAGRVSVQSTAGQALPPSDILETQIVLVA